VEVISIRGKRDALNDLVRPGRGTSASAFTRVFDALWAVHRWCLDTKSRKQPHAK